MSLKGTKQSPEHIEKRRNALIGKKLSEQHRKKISENQKGRKHHPETIEKIRLSLIGKTLGYKRSEETKRKISEVQKGRKDSPELAARRGLAIRGYKHTEAYKNYISEKWHTHHPPETRKGNRKGNKHTEEARAKIRQKRLHQVFPVTDTSIEIALQKGLQKVGIQFETHKAILGQPDIFIQPNICIFADGCYWHGCQECIERNLQKPIHRANKIKDEMITQGLISKGYIVLRFWEHEINSNIEAVIKYIQNNINCKAIA